MSLNDCEKLRSECDNIIESNHFLDEINKISVFDASERDEAASRVNKREKFKLILFYFSLKNH